MLFRSKIWLAEIPFVRLREGIPSELLDGKASYTDAVQAVQQSLPNSLLKIDIRIASLSAAGWRSSFHRANWLSTPGMHSAGWRTAMQRGSAGKTRWVTAIRK